MNLEDFVWLYFFLEKSFCTSQRLTLSCTKVQCRRKIVKILSKLQLFRGIFEKGVLLYFGGKILNLQGQKLLRGMPLPHECLMSLTGIQLISPTFCEFWPKFQENHSNHLESCINCCCFSWKSWTIWVPISVWSIGRWIFPGIAKYQIKTWWNSESKS